MTVERYLEQADVPLRSAEVIFYSVALAVVVFSGALLHARHHDDRRSTVLLGVGADIDYGSDAHKNELADL